MPRPTSVAILLSTVTLALSACGGGPATVPAPTATTLEFSVPPTLRLGSTTPLTVVARDASGAVVSGTAILTSSDSRLLSVGADGAASALRLTPDTAPVTLTAKFGTLEKTAQISTYGLELAGGTYNSNFGTPQAALGTALTTRFRPPAGAAPFSKVPVSLTGPTGFDAGLFPVTVSKPLTEGTAGTSNLARSAQRPVAGSYTASVTVNGELYTASATLDPTSVLTPPGTPAVALTSTGLTLNASPAPGTTVSATVYASGPALALTRDRGASELPYSYTFPAPLAPGVYNRGVFGYSSPTFAFTSPTPPQLNVSFSYLGTTTVQ